MPQVALEKTSYAAPIIAGVFVYAYERVMGHSPPTQSSYLMPMAQSAFETGYWASMYNNNLGNVTATSDTQDWMHESAGGHRFRAYKTLGDGALDMMLLLKRRGVMPFADANDLSGYVGALAHACYMGCPPEGSYVTYQNGMSSAMHKYNGIAPVPYVESPMGISTGMAIAIGAGLLAVAAGTAYVIHEGILDEPRVRRNPAKLERCVRKVKKQKGTRNAWAICTAALKRAQ